MGTRHGTHRRFEQALNRCSFAGPTHQETRQYDPPCGRVYEVNMFIRGVMPLYIRTRSSTAVTTLAVHLCVFVCGWREYWETVKL